MHRTRVESIAVFRVKAFLNDQSDHGACPRILPTVKSRIKTREKITAPLYNSVEITRVKVPATSDDAADGVPAYADEDDQTYVLQQYGLNERLDYRWIFR